ncbi:MAG: nitrous oxide-stimulated promoter family protein [Anaerolineaceae bacterium]
MPKSENAVNPKHILQEQKTVSKMILLYCRAKHQPESGLCAECEELRAYSLQRIARCPFQPDKPTCGKCPVHCYRPEMRERIRAVMRYAGPRMLTSDPVAAVRHLVRTFRKPSEKVRRAIQRQNDPV